MRLASTGFDDGGTIPKRFTCSGEDVSPPLAIRGMPGETRELALVVEDPDADRFVHWSVLGIAPDTALIGAGKVPPGAVQTENGFGDRAGARRRRFGRRSARCAGRPRAGARHVDGPLRALARSPTSPI
jgi:phosphatidylethanolamine-binding protein (PEBP) family uncharacterized protein